MKVLTFGELLLRLAAPGYNKLFQKDVLECTFCGGEANVAVSLANFGVASVFVTKLPDSDVGKAAANSLKYFNVDTSKIIFGQGRMGLFYLEKGASQRPSKVIYDRADSAVACSTPDEYNWDSLFGGVDWFHFTGISPALSETVRETTLQACKYAKQKGIAVSCDLNFRNKLWSSEQAKATMTKLMPYVDVCIGNEEDAEKTLGIVTNSNVECGKLDRDAYIDVAKQIADNYGCKYVAITLRESYSASVNGWSAMLYAGQAAYFSKKYDIQLVDRVGGGDSFAGGLIYGLMHQLAPQDVIEFAVAASCLKQTIEGDYNRVSVDDVYALMESGGSGRIKR